MVHHLHIDPSLIAFPPPITPLTIEQRRHDLTAKLANQLIFARPAAIRATMLELHELAVEADANGLIECAAACRTAADDADTTIRQRGTRA